MDRLQEPVLHPIDSLDSFVQYRRSPGSREICFVRALGESPDLADQIERIDSMMTSLQDGSRYLRISSLPVLDAVDTAFCSEAVRKYSGSGPLPMRTAPAPAAAPVLKAAVDDAVERYRSSRTSVTESMAVNFRVKLWYWSDRVLGQILSVWDKNQTVKIIAQDVRREQEYLFWRAAACLGFDVLLLNSRGDVKTGDSLKSLSAVLQLGPFGNTEIPAWKEPPAAEGRRNGTSAPSSSPAQRQAPASASGTRNRDQGQSGNIRIVLPPRPDRKNRSGTSAPRQAAENSPQQQTAPRQTPQERANWNTPSSARRKAGSPAQKPASAASQTPGTPAQKPAPPVQEERRERSYEELATLASSVVMIAVMDRKGKVRSTGSGIMIGRDGFILTNFHVVRGGAVFAVRMEDEENAFLTSDVIKYQQDQDLALIRIDRELVPIPVYSGSRPLVRGQKVVAIGSPLGLFNTVSDGIISGFRSREACSMIQFTAPISHGSSGGAVLNLYGEVIGISSAGFDEGQNLNLAVPYEVILPFIRGFTG